ncbi:MAG: radical SAM protein [Methanomicrobiales archaeon]|jgi:radical SAM protein with 4Fe4S-binding SPASM domain|nr:radical SAM protein [Methanomicrobiales archaeon]
MKVEVDSHKLIYHPDRVAQWLSTGDCPPVYVEIGLTNRCNHRCIFCALDWLEKKPVFIDADVLKERLTEMKDFGVRSVMFAGEGEPLMHPQAAEIIEHAYHAGLDLSVSTNGVFFTPDMARRILPCLKWIRISLDAASPIVHHQIHQGKISDFETIYDNIVQASRLKREEDLSVVIGVQLLIIPENLHEIVSFTRLFAGSGADNVQIKPYSKHPLSINRFVIDPQLLTGVEEEIMAFEKEGFQVIFRSGTIDRLSEERIYDRCYGLPFYALIEADGSVIPCNLYHENKEYTYGNCITGSFVDVWNGLQRKSVLKKIQDGGISRCREVCRLDPVNRYLHALKHPHPHVNFI